MRTPGRYAQMAAARASDTCVRIAQRGRRWGSLCMNAEISAVGTARTSRGAEEDTSLTMEEATPSFGHRCARGQSCSTTRGEFAARSCRAAMIGIMALIAVIREWVHGADLLEYTVCRGAVKIFSNDVALSGGDAEASVTGLDEGSRRLEQFRLCCERSVAMAGQGALLGASRRS